MAGTRYRSAGRRVPDSGVRAFAERVAADGIETGWAPILAALPPVVGAMVRDAVPRSDPAGIVAAAAIGHDRSFRSVAELATITAPALVFPGTDPPDRVGRGAAAALPHGEPATVRIDGELRTAEDLARATAPTIRAFLGP
ncbi:hypothetical protein [Streptomyces sp. NPDC088794]|uniref:hypothetical protein n=1 Tax=Streptomyces sp. NPDC088794 TaxID=3365902 RepID=UPI003815B190